MIALLLTAAMAAGAPDDAFEAFFKEFAAKRDGIYVLEAQFTQTTVLPEEVLTTKGSLLYAQPRRIVLRTDEPLENLIDGRRGYEYDPELEQLLVYDFEDNPKADVFFLGFENDTESLRKGFEVSLFTAEGDARGTRGLILKPKEEDKDDAPFLEVSLNLRDADFLPYRIRIKQDDSEVITEVTDYTINGAPDPKKAQLFLPEGTKVVVNDRVIETVGTDGKLVPEPIEFGPGKSRGDVPEWAEDEAKAAVGVSELPAPGAAP